MTNLVSISKVINLLFSLLDLATLEMILEGLTRFTGKILPFKEYVNVFLPIVLINLLSNPDFILLISDDFISIFYYHSTIFKDFYMILST